MTSVSNLTQRCLFDFDESANSDDIDNAEFLPGFRYVSIFVDNDNCLPPKKNSATDITLLRAANMALKRSADGYKDTFLFISPIFDKQNAIDALVKQYGFPYADVVCLDYDEAGFNLALEGDVGDDIASKIDSWLSENHPETVAYLHGPYAFEQFWWTGIDHDSDHDRCPWHFDIDKLKAQLPDTHRNRPNLWLSILINALDLEPDSLESDEISQDKAVALLATLCEWLHGFESASGNTFNDFEHGYFASEIGPSEFFLGFQAARLTTDEIEHLSEDYEYEIDVLRAAAFKLITEDLRDEISSGLSRFFGGDVGLFWALYSAIWPKFDMKMDDAAEELTNMKYIDYGEIADGWEFVSSGWCDKADIE